MRSRVSTLFFLALLPIGLAGCYASHLEGASADGGTECGALACGSGEQCCNLCHGETICVPADGMCPAPDCPPDGCTSNADCPSREYCAFAPGSCGGMGFCDVRGDRCPLDPAPVCGCDGNTYMNACLATRSGVSVASEGPCAVPCGRGGPICQPNEYCESGPLCGADDGFVGCRPRPRDCPPGGTPVCGCDGTFYPNECVAAMAGVSATTPDRCGAPDPSAVCVGFCDLLTTCGATGDCVGPCVANLGDCSMDELGRVAACTAIGDCMRAIECVADIACVR